MRGVESGGLIQPEAATTLAPLSAGSYSPRFPTDLLQKADSQE